MHTKATSPWQHVIRSGLIAGAVSVLLSLVGMVAAFGERYIISGWVTMGQVLFLAPIFYFSYSAVRKIEPQSPGVKILSGVVCGLVGNAILALLVVVGQAFNIRAMFVNASPAMFELLTFGQSTPAGILILLGLGAVIGGVTAGILLLPPNVRNAVIQGIVWVALVGLVRDLLVSVVAQWVEQAKKFPEWLAWLGPVFSTALDVISRRIFAASGLRPISAVILFIIIGGYQLWRSKAAANQTVKAPRTRKQATTRLIFFAVVALILPLILGIFFAEVLDNVGLFILMGLGLNIVVGFAGLLDLGYVAFYAIGAYVMAVLTSPELGFFNLTFWQALPFALLASLMAGVILGLPVLKMRGDYLAIVTLGFGEIVRLLVLSDWLRPWLGGTQGIQRIAQPRVGPILFDSQTDLYYLFLIGIGIVAFVAWRLKDSRLGRAWMALREDEDVAVAMGINHVTTKLMAFATGALFSGLAGTIFAAKLTSVYPHSMNFLVSINVLSLIIIGGMGSIPGVFVGALVLIGAPDLLREFAEYRYLAYGALLVAMMLNKPEGLWPEERRKLELHEAELEAGAAVET